MGSAHAAISAQSNPGTQFRTIRDPVVIRILRAMPNTVNKMLPATCKLRPPHTSASTRRSRLADIADI
jgi:hypothetical protein